MEAISCAKCSVRIIPAFVLEYGVWTQTLVDSVSGSMLVWRRLDFRIEFEVEAISREKKGCFGAIPAFVIESGMWTETFVVVV